jgi:hypothetical protein
MNINSIIYICLIAILLFYILTIYSASTCPTVEFNKINKRYTDIKDNLDTGDLVFFCSDDYYSKCIRKFGNCVFSHVGLIIKLNDIVFILECDLDGSYDFLSKKENKHGVHLVQLDEKIYNYDGYMFGYKKLINGKINKNELDKLIKLTNNISFDTSHLNLLGTVFKNNLYSRMLNTNNKMFCSQYLAFIYKKLGIIEDKMLDCQFSINDFLKDFDTINNYKYDKIQYFKFNKNDKKQFYKSNIIE